MKFSTALRSLVLLAVSSFTEAHQEGDIAVHVTVTTGYPSGGANCVEEEKQIVINTLGKSLQAQGSDVTQDHIHDPEWCEALCRPHTAVFCKVFHRRCKTAFGRRLLAQVGEEEDLSTVPFLTLGEGERKLPHKTRMLRGLQLMQVSSGMTMEEEQQCKDLKTATFNTMRDDAGALLSNSCKSMMQQLLQLNCFKVGEGDHQDVDFVPVDDNSFMARPDHAITTDDPVSDSVSIDEGTSGALEATANAMEGEAMEGEAIQGVATINGEGVQTEGATGFPDDPVPYEQEVTTGDENTADEMPNFSGGFANALPSFDTEESTIPEFDYEAIIDQDEELYQIGGLN